LNSSESPQAEAISELSELVPDTIEKIADILEKRKQEPDVNHPQS
jgi:uncharacterized spore protein YtfJ